MEKKVVLITGSSRGIGKAIAQEFAKGNYKVILNCINNIEKMKELEKNLKKINVDVHSIICDVSKFYNVKIMFDEIEKKYGNVDILVNNAGISYTGVFNNMEEKDWQKVMEVNINSTINCSRLAIPSMINKKNGIIINISSIWGQVGGSCEVIYSMTKASIDGFTKALAKEVGPSGIRVNAIAPGLIDTDMNNNLTVDEKQFLIDEIPLGTIGNPNDIGKCCRFLAENESKYITGQIIKVDGGFTN